MTKQYEYISAFKLIKSTRTGKYIFFYHEHDAEQSNLWIHAGFSITEHFRRNHHLAWHSLREDQ